jgi:fumarate reductase subunit D
MVLASLTNFRGRLLIFVLLALSTHELLHHTKHST